MARDEQEASYIQMLDIKKIASKSKPLYREMVRLPDAVRVQIRLTAVLETQCAQDKTMTVENLDSDESEGVIRRCDEKIPSEIFAAISREVQQERNSDEKVLNKIENRGL